MEKKSPELLKLLSSVEQINYKIENIVGAEIKFDDMLQKLFNARQPIGEENIEKLNLFDQAYEGYIKLLQTYYDKIRNPKVHKDLGKEISTLAKLLRTIEIAKSSNPEFEEYGVYIKKMTEHLNILAEALLQTNSAINKEI